MKEEDKESLPKMIYQDGIQPTVKTIGNFVAQAVDAALSKPKLWVTKKQFNFERTRKLLVEKLQNVDPETIVPPENHIAVPALMQISYCFDSDELREMYANLLASSMQIDKKWEVHPAFVDIIKQLTPDEAKLLKAIPFSTYSFNPIINILDKFPDDKGYTTIYASYTDIADGICESPQKIGAYLDNLDRLKLIELDMNTFITDEAPYDKLKQTDFVQNITKKPLRTNHVYDFAKGCFKLTAFGSDFIKVCIK